MSVDLSTYAGQAQHYSGVSARLWNPPSRLPPSGPRRRSVAIRVRCYDDLLPKRPPEPPKGAGGPVIVRTPAEVTQVIVRDVLLVSSADFIGRGDWKEIALEVANKHRLTLQQLKGEQRSRYIVLARHELYFRLAHETTMSLPEIGRRLGGKDHTGVIHGIRRHAERNGLEVIKGRRAA